MTPAPDTGRAAEENELREALTTFIADRFWRTPGQAANHADALLSGPLAPILQEAATARKERDEARASLEECAELVNEYAAAAVPKGMEILAKDRDKWFDTAQAAEQEAATLRARLQEAEKALKPFADVCDADHMRYIKDEQVLELSTRAEVPVSEKLRGRDFRAARAALNPNQEAGDHEPR